MMTGAQDRAPFARLGPSRPTRATLCPFVFLSLCSGRPCLWRVEHWNHWGQTSSDLLRSSMFVPRRASDHALAYFFTVSFALRTSIRLSGRLWSPFFGPFFWFLSIHSFLSYRLQSPLSLLGWVLFIFSLPLFSFLFPFSLPFPHPILPSLSFAHSIQSLLLSQSPSSGSSFLSAPSLGLTLSFRSFATRSRSRSQHLTQPSR